MSLLPPMGPPRAGGGCHCGGACCAVYGPRRQTPEQRQAEIDKVKREIEEHLATPEGQQLIADMRRGYLLEQGKRDLGQGLTELLCGEG